MTEGRSSRGSLPIRALSHPAPRKNPREWVPTGRSSAQGHSDLTAGARLFRARGARLSRPAEAGLWIMAHVTRHLSARAAKLPVRLA